MTLHDKFKRFFSGSPVLVAILDIRFLTVCNMKYAWYCINFHVMAKYCMVFHDNAWICMILDSIVCYWWYCNFLRLNRKFVHIWTFVYIHVFFSTLDQGLMHLVFFLTMSCAGWSKAVLHCLPHKDWVPKRVDKKMEQRKNICVCCLQRGAKRVVLGAFGLLLPAYPEVAQVDCVVGRRSRVRRLWRTQALHLVHHLNCEFIVF